MIGSKSETTGKIFSTRFVLNIFKISPATWYAKKSGKKSSKKRGPKTFLSDIELLQLLKKKIEFLPFFQVGYKKLHLYLRKDGVRVGKERIRRIMSEENLLLRPPGGTGSARPHNGRLIEDEPNKTWATDGKKFFTQKEGWCWFFGAIDHFNNEILAWNTSEIGTRHEAMRPVSDAVEKVFGSICKDIATGVSLRVDCGSQYKSHYFRNEAAYVGIAMSYTFARSPESNGIIERFHRTLEEQVFAVNQFADLEEARTAIEKFIHDYNTLWILHRSEGKTPLEMREEYEKNKLKKCA